jgi:hypothetical protein
MYPYIFHGSDHDNQHHHRDISTVLHRGAIREGGGGGRGGKVRGSKNKPLIHKRKAQKGPTPKKKKMKQQVSNKHTHHKQKKTNRK